MRIISDFLPPAFRQIALTIAAHGNHWAAGRQGTGYEKLDIKGNTMLRPIIMAALNHLGVPDDWGFWDSYLLRYPDGAFIPKHKDEAEMFGMDHHRLNAIVRNAPEGGVLLVKGKAVRLRQGDAILFRPDDEEHEVTPCIGERLVLTVGCWKERKVL